jgi:GH25 family lysozyme M1 (1,4-beta-N-acetylmuramidase)
VLVTDPKFKSNVQGARAAGLKVGVYFFTQAINEVEAVEEASMTLSLIKGLGIGYPVFIDTEACGGRADGISAEQRTAVCRAFCETIKSGGYTPGVYASKAWYNNNVNFGSLSGYKIWLAQYASKPTFSGKYDLWQHTAKGSVDGIKGNVDMNISYLGY